MKSRHTSGWIAIQLSVSLFIGVVNAHATGEVVPWGANWYGQTNVPAGLSNVVAVTAGYAHSLALKSDGTLSVWGRFGDSTTYIGAYVPTDLSNVTAIASGYDHCVALKNDSTVVSWGLNMYNRTNVPAGLSNVVAVAAGRYHSLALKDDGSVVTWGSYYDASTWPAIYGPVVVPSGLRNVIAIAAGENSDMALTGEGTVVYWDYYGRTNFPAGPTPLVAGTVFNNGGVGLAADGTIVQWNALACPDPSHAIALGRNWVGSLALKDNGTVMAWGYNYYGETNVPPGLTNVVAIAGGTGHSLAVVGGGSPVLITQPRNQMPFTGKTAVFSAMASGSRPLSYQWTFNGTNLVEATNQFLIITNALPENVGAYAVVVSNALGIAVSGSATLALSNCPPTMVLQPTNRVSFPGGMASFSVAGDGSMPLSFQWFLGQTMIPGANASSLTFTNLAYADAGSYSAVISNSFGAVTSTVATLRVMAVAAWGLNSSGQTYIPASLTNVGNIAAGAYENLAINHDTTVTAWGPSSYVPNYLDGVVALASGGSHALALRSDGSVVAWGGNSYGQTDVPFFDAAIGIAAGLGHSLAVLPDGTVTAWGHNLYGQCNVPSDVSRVVAVSAGDYFSLALKSDGTVRAWGAAEPCVIPDSATNVIAIAAGGSHALALRSDGTVIAWGSNSNGQTNVPSGLTNIVAISAGSAHSMALKADGSVAVWGAWYNNLTNPPAGLHNVIGIACGPGHNVVLIGDGSPVITLQPVSRTAYAGDTMLLAGAAVSAQPVTYQWQRNGVNISNATNSTLLVSNVQAAQGGVYTLVISNALGIVTSAPATISVYQGPPFFLSQPVNQIVRPFTNALFTVSADGNIPITYQWRFNGANLTDATGSALTLPPITLSQVGDYSVVVGNPHGAITSAVAHLDMVRVAAWNESGYGPSLRLAGLSQPPLDLTNVSAIANGYGHCLALRGDGTVAAWGTNDYGQLNVPSGLSNVVGISAGTFHSLAVKSDGTVVAWGGNGGGQSTVPAGLANVVAVAAGGLHSMALKGDGTVVAWGTNNQNQLQVPPTLPKVVAIAAGYYHCLVLRTNGAVTAWGNNTYGQTTVPLNATNIIAISAGMYKSAALREDGTIIEWGNAASSLSTNLSICSFSSGDSQNLFVLPDGTARSYTWSGVLPVALTNVVAVAAGRTISLALIDDGARWPAVQMPMPTISAPTSFNVPTITGKAYFLQFKNSLSDPRWVIRSGVVGDGNPRSLTDSAALGAQRFYRVRRQ